MLVIWARKYEECVRHRQINWEIQDIYGVRKEENYHVTTSKIT